MIDIIPGKTYKGIVNGRKLKVLKIQKDTAILEDAQTKRIFMYGKEQLKRCAIKISE